MINSNLLDVRPVGIIHVDFNKVDIDIFDKKYILGELAYHLEFELEVIFGAQDGVLKFEATSNGRVIGNASIKFADTNYY